MAAVALIAGWLILGLVIRKGLGLDAEIDEVAANGREVLFDERFVSGHRLPVLVGAGWALRVIIDKQNVWIWPMLPFRPTFLAMCFGLEHKFPRNDVSVLSVASPEHALFGRRSVVVSAKSKTGRAKKLKLYLKKPEAFVGALSTPVSAEDA
jgi:hypothetical protein